MLHQTRILPMMAPLVGSTWSPLVPGALEHGGSQRMADSTQSIVVRVLASLALVASGLSLGCGGGGEKPPTASIEATPTANSADSTEATLAAASAKPQKKQAVDPIVLVRTSAGDIKIQLFAEKAPQTVDNFLRNYVQRHFYEGTIVHHVDAAMVLFGGYGADLQPKETRAEIYNESANGLPNKRGFVAMARSPEVPHSATSQFFVNLTDNEGFDYQSTDEGEAFGYCVFGQVIEGLEIVDQIANSPVTAQGDFPAVPNPPVVVEAINQVR